MTLGGGTDPDAAALANGLAHRGVTGPDRPLGCSSWRAASGSATILWEFAHDESRILNCTLTDGLNGKIAGYC